MKSQSKVRGPPSKVLSRKEKRKAERKLKKARKDAFAQRKFDSMKNLKDIDSDYKFKSGERKKIQKTEAKKRRKNNQKKKKAQAEKKKVEDLRQEIQEDDFELKQLEKKLKLNKRKGISKLPQSFADDGLDYLLDATESEKIKDFDDIAMTLPSLKDSESDSELESDSDNLSENKDPVPEFTGTVNPDATNVKSILKVNKKGTEKKSVKFSGSKEEEEGIDSDNLGTDHSEDDFSDLDNEADFSDENINESDVEEEVRGEEIKKHDNVKNTNLDESDEKKVIKGSEQQNLKKRKLIDTSEELKEDIYGRLRDKEGNIVKPSGAGTYIPPAKRAMMAGAGQANEALQKKLKGFVNKISEGTIQVLSSQVESLYLEHSRNDVNETLSGLIFEAVISPVLTPERLVAELAMLIAILHSNVGSEVGAFFLQKLAVKFKELLDIPDYGIGKNMDNILMLLSNLYNFKIVSSTLMIDLMQKLINKFGYRDIELLLLLFKNTGFTLRKDDPVQLKQVILDIQAKARDSQIVAEEGMESRVKFMLEILTAIRNNNMRKIPGYDPTHLEHLRKITKSFLRGQVLGDNVLTIGLDDLLKADQHGRWWIVGSAWDGRQDKDDNLKDAKAVTQASQLPSMSKKMLKIAKMQGMNTDVRRQIFCILGTSEDFEDAFSRLLRLGLNRSQEREIIHVIFHCCLGEKEFNPFYAFLTERFCSFDRRFTITVQFTMWDKFKEVDTMGKEARTKLGHFLSHLLLSKALSLSVLKVIEFGMESKKMIRLLIQVLSEILGSPNLVTVTEIFERVAPLAKLKPLCQGLQVFLRVHLKGVTVKGLSSSALQERIEKVESAMFSRQSMLL